MSGYWSKSLCSKRGGSLCAQISGGMGRRPPTTVGVRKLRVPELSRGVVCVILRFAVLVHGWLVIDRHTMTAKGVWSGHVNHFKFWSAPTISL